MRAPLTLLWYSLITGGIVFTASMIFTLTSIEEATVFTAIIASLFAFSFAACLFYEDSWVKEVILALASKSINFPMLIWEFSFDGFIWLIGMKLLFWVIGALAGVLFAILGVIIGFIISPVALIFDIYNYVTEGRYE